MMKDEARVKLLDGSGRACQGFWLSSLGVDFICFYCRVEHLAIVPINDLQFHIYALDSICFL